MASVFVAQNAKGVKSPGRRSLVWGVDDADLPIEVIYSVCTACVENPRFFSYTRVDRAQNYTFAGSPGRILSIRIFNWVSKIVKTITNGYDR